MALFLQWAFPTIYGMHVEICIFLYAVYIFSLLGSYNVCRSIFLILKQINQKLTGFKMGLIKLTGLKLDQMKLT